MLMKGREGEMQIGALIVDDEEDIRFLIRTLIEAANRELHVSGEAATGSEALERLDDLDPQVIVLDERMPGMSGTETAALILRRRPGQRIIVCSAYLDAELRQKAEALGIKVCLTKQQIGTIPDVLRELMAENAAGG